jgi:hypothetical protein
MIILVICNDNIGDLYSSPDILRVIGYMGVLSMDWGGGRNARRVFVQTPERHHVGRHSRRWKDTINMDVTEIGFEGVDWIHLAQDKDRYRAVVNAVMNFRVQQNT